MLESSQLALQIHESVGHAVELDRILGSEAAYAGTSWVSATDRGTLRYGSPLMTVIADATTPYAMGTFGYDDEGVPAGQAPIVTDGVLTGYLTDRQSAAMLGEQSNGTARADSWGDIPLIRMNNVSLQPGEGDRASIVADTDDGFLFLTNRSWSIDDKAAELPVRLRGRLRDPRRAARADVPQPHVRRPDAGLLGILRRARRTDGLEGVGRAELRQGPAVADRARRARRTDRPVPRDAGSALMWGEDRLTSLADAALRASAATSRSCCRARTAR